MDKLITLVCLTAFLAPAAAQTEQPPIERWFDLGGTAWLQGTDVMPAQMLPLHASIYYDIGDYRQSDVGRQSRESRPGADDGHEILTMLLGSELMETCGFDILSSGQVRVSGPEASVARIGAALDALRKESTRQARITVYELSGRAVRAIESPTLDAEAVAKLLGAHPALAVSRQAVVLGDATRFTSGRRVGIVARSDVEVAQSATIDDPDSRTLLLGQDLTVLVHRGTGGKLHVQCASRHARMLSSPSAVPVGSGSVFGQQAQREEMSLGRIQTARIASSLGRSSAMLADGEAFLFGVGQNRSGRALLVQVRADQPAALPDERTTAYPLGQLIRRGLRGSVYQPQVQSVRPGMDSLDEWQDKEEPRSPIAVENLMDRIQNEADLRGEGDEIQVRYAGDHLFVSASKGFRAHVASMLDRLAANHGRTLHFELRFGAVDLQALAKDEQAALEALPIAGRMAAREGDLAALVSGQERSRVVDYAVEIAQAATTRHPNVATIFTGLSLVGEAHATPENTVLFDGRLFWQEERSRDNFDSAGVANGAVDQADTVHLENRGLWKLTPGRWTTVLLAPDRASGQHIACAIRVTVD